MDFADIPFTAPPGDKGLDLSYEGGEHEMFEGLAEEIVGLTGFRRIDPRVRRDHIETRNEHWGLQVDRLVAAYLHYRKRDLGDGIPSPLVDEDTVDGTACPALHDIELVDLFSHRHTSLSAQASQVFPNETLIHHGYLGSSPLYPTVAISIRTLAAYCQIHRTCPQFSIQAQCKALCHMHNFTDAYDIYLEIIYRVDQQLKVALKRDAPNWRLLNACPACFYKLEDEPDLCIDYLITMDGNNSLKQWSSWMYGGTPRTDTHSPRSNYWLTPEAVDKFKDEVQSCSKAPTSDNGPDDDWDDDDDSPISDCVRRWHNAGPEQCKRMFRVYDEFGIFIAALRTPGIAYLTAACCHRFVLLACNMIRSGEL
ncbi:hypothetical protein BV22DRAFT_1107609 [Leucogyrophana mollusca]|uniref:Uncharacterized protein n=1 Tax=Leucogyrophana mollusca TaxID=85980 RepID=A0ACB8B4J7_9AGAM|nr:hypothetical protein BV22DRAFT_1107609 [Leucogyrophana mollusca]